MKKRGGLAADPVVPLENRGWARPTPCVLQAVEALADQDIDRNAAVLCLAFYRFIVS
jgi:hypothetical protein